MKLLCHRGLWTDPEAKNSRAAIEDAAHSGYGTETDVRDLSGRLVISHDPPRGGELPLDAVLKVYDDRDLTLALNIKADGLCQMVSESLASCQIPWFAFDMSVPEMVRYAAQGVPFFTRHSDREPDPILYEAAEGVWLDGFETDWYDDSFIKNHLSNGKSVCVVSPELHGRDPSAVWKMMKKFRNAPGLMLCTDYIDRAKEVIEI